MIFLKDDEFDKLEKELIIKLDTHLLVERYKFYHDCYSKKVKLNNVYNIIHDECNLTENEIKKIKGDAKNELWEKYNIRVD